jgi:hypothetical protein
MSASRRSKKSPGVPRRSPVRGRGELLARRDAAPDVVARRRAAASAHLRVAQDRTRLRRRRRRRGGVPLPLRATTAPATGSTTRASGGCPRTRTPSSCTGCRRIPPSSIPPRVSGRRRASSSRTTASSRPSNSETPRSPKPSSSSGTSRSSSRATSSASGSHAAGADRSAAGAANNACSAGHPHPRSTAPSSMPLSRGERGRPPLPKHARPAAENPSRCRVCSALRPTVAEPCAGR